MLDLLVMALLAKSAPKLPYGYSEAHACELARAAAKRPPSVEELLNAVAVRDTSIVVCSMKFVNAHYRSRQAMKALPPGWRKTVEANWSHDICTNIAWGAMVKAGWLFDETIDFADGQRVSIDAVCQK